MKEKTMYYQRKTGMLIDSDNNVISNENQQLIQMLETMKTDKIESILISHKECISDNEHDVYLMCKLAEEKGVEVQFINENLSSKDIIKEYEENNMTGAEMNL